jgi:cytidylate kinase
MGVNISLEEVMVSIKERDEIDKTRRYSPLTKVSDAIEIDTTNLDVEMVIERIKNIIKECNL